MRGRCRGRCCCTNRYVQHPTANCMTSRACACSDDVASINSMIRKALWLGIAYQQSCLLLAYPTNSGRLRGPEQPAAQRVVDICSANMLLCVPCCRATPCCSYRHQSGCCQMSRASCRSCVQQYRCVSSSVVSAVQVSSKLLELAARM